MKLADEFLMSMVVFLPWYNAARVILRWERDLLLIFMMVMMIRTIFGSRRAIKVKRDVCVALFEVVQMDGSAQGVCLPIV
jgi:hypothetical protein